MHPSAPFQHPRKRLTPLHAFSDNYIWVMEAGALAWVVDPGEPFSVLDHLSHRGLVLGGILLTHHHDDHTGGVDRLRRLTGAKVCGPAQERLPDPVQRLFEGDLINALGSSFRVIDVPGHTAGHIAYYTPDFDGCPVLFSGDALFSGGCGRLFEGSAAQMLGSLDKLACLPPETLVCCAHEYTLGNLRFAQAVEPDNLDVKARLHWCEALRASGEPTLPSTVATELKINPFLRSRLPSVRQAVARVNSDVDDDVAVFAALRAWKNEFR